MTNYQTGADALNVLQGGGESTSSSNKFTSLASGSTLFVKVLGVSDFFTYFGYGMYQPKVYTFAAKNPSKKSKKGYPVEDLTPWDKAWKYHADKSEKFQDKHSSESYKYSPKARGAFGLYDLTTGEQIVVDFTKNQANIIIAAITKYATRIDRIAFELTKTGESTNTVVTMTPVLDMTEDLTDVQRANFEKAPKEFDKSLFEGVVFEMSDEEMTAKLVEVGFDVSLIGLAKTTPPTDASPVDNTQVDIDELPF